MPATGVRLFSSDGRRRKVLFPVHPAADAVGKSIQGLRHQREEERKIDGSDPFSGTGASAIARRKGLQCLQIPAPAKNMNDGTLRLLSEHVMNSDSNIDKLKDDEKAWAPLLPSDILPHIF